MKLDFGFFKAVWILIVVMVVAFPTLAMAQGGKLSPPAGEGVQNVVMTRNGYFFYTSKMLRMTSNFGIKTWTPPSGYDIINVFPKKPDDHIVEILVVGPNGSVDIWATYFGSLGWDYPLRYVIDEPRQFHKIVGDALYGIVQYDGVYISRDTAATWQIDSTGLGSGYPLDITVDTLQYVYCASSNGLFKQHPDSSYWDAIGSFPDVGATAVFADRMNRVFVARYDKVYLSTNSGSTWAIDTAGLHGDKAVLGLTGFCDDAFGNVYAYSPAGIWRSSGGTGSWTRIDAPLLALALDPSTYTLFNSLSGDSLLYASTVFGAYTSSDQGTTWTQDASQFGASFIYGFGKTSSGRMLTTTSLGVYYKNPGDPQWTKTFPTTGYVSASPVYLDNAGNAYTLGAATSSTFESLRTNWKSTDGGLTWNPDSAGLGGLTGQGVQYFVDETGTQHFGPGYPIDFYSKTSGGSWIPDTAGLGIRTTDLATAFGSDHHGFVYGAVLNLSTFIGMMWKRPIGGGAWTPDTAGLGGNTVYWITAEKNGTPLAGTGVGLYRKSGGQWTLVPAPAGLAGYAAFVASVDSSGHTIAGFSVSYGLNYFWRGLYATTDSGTTWNYLGLDSISVRGLISYGDSTYGYTYADGLYKVQSTGSQTSVPPGKRLSSYKLEQNYPNPFNPTTTIKFSVERSGQTTLRVYNVLGQMVRELFNGVANAGQDYQIRLDANSIGSGVYYYTITTPTHSETKKMVLIR